VSTLFNLLFILLFLLGPFLLLVRLRKAFFNRILLHWHLCNNHNRGCLVNLNELLTRCIWRLLI
jgi:hypothetical protein